MIFHLFSAQKKVAIRGKTYVDYLGGGHASTGVLCSKKILFQLIFYFAPDESNSFSLLLG